MTGKWGRVGKNGSAGAGGEPERAMGENMIKLNSIHYENVSEFITMYN